MNRITAILFSLLVVVAGMAMSQGRADSPKPEIGSERYYQLVDSADRRLALKQWTLAEEALKNALREEPGNPGNTLLFSNLGVAQMEQGKATEALQSFSLALTRAPKSTVILTHRTRVLISLGRDKEALGDLGAILAIDSINEWALQTRGLIRLQSAGGENRERFDDFRVLARNHAENPWGWFGLGVECEEKGEEAMAVEYYRKAYGLGHDAEISFRLAMLLLKRNDIPETMALLREALKENPTDGNLYAAMGWAHKKTYQTEESAADLKLARQYGASPEILKWIESTGTGVENR